MVEPTESVRSATNASQRRSQSCEASASFGLASGKSIKRAKYSMRPLSMLNMVDGDTEWVELSSSPVNVNSYFQALEGFSSSLDAIENLAAPWPWRTSQCGSSRPKHLANSRRIISFQVSVGWRCGRTMSARSLGNSTEVLATLFRDECWVNQSSNIRQLERISVLSSGCSMY